MTDADIAWSETAAPASPRQHACAACGKVIRTPRWWLRKYEAGGPLCNACCGLSTKAAIGAAKLQHHPSGRRR